MGRISLFGPHELPGAAYIESEMCYCVSVYIVSEGECVGMRYKVLVHNNLVSVAIMNSVVKQANKTIGILYVNVTVNICHVVCYSPLIVDAPFSQTQPMTCPAV